MAKLVSSTFKNFVSSIGISALKDAGPNIATLAKNLATESLTTSLAKAGATEGSIAAVKSTRTALLKNVDELGGVGKELLSNSQTIISKSIIDVAEDGTFKVIKNGVVDNSIKNLDEVAEIAAKTTGNATAPVKSLSSRIYSVSKMIGVVGIAAGGIYLVINPLVAFENKNGKILNITGIIDYSATTGTPGATLITYTPGVALYDGNGSSSSPDTLSFSGTTCIPALTGSYNVAVIIDQLSVIIVIPEAITTPQTTEAGTMVLSTTYANQSALQGIQLKDNIKALGGGVAGGVAGGIAGGLGEGLKEVSKNIFESLGIDFSFIKYIIIIIVIIVVLVISFKIYQAFRKNKSAFSKRKR